MRIFNYFWFKQDKNYNKFVRENIDLVALGTLADIVELKNEIGH